MKRIIFLALVLLAGCGTSPYQSEYNAYKEYLQAEVYAGRVSLEQGNYMLANKFNDLSGRQQAYNANAAATSALAIQMMNAGAPRPVYNNAMSCTSFRQGQYVTTNCQ